jgi:hypothetical protein
MAEQIGDAVPPWSDLPLKLLIAQLRKGLVKRLITSFHELRIVTPRISSFVIVV